MSRTEKNKLEYTVALIADFAAAFNLSKKQAYNYCVSRDLISFSLTTM